MDLRQVEWICKASISDASISARLSIRVGGCIVLGAQMDLILIVQLLTTCVIDLGFVLVVYLQL